MNLFSAHGLAKSYHDVALFENIAFGMEEGERVGLIGSNGVGKTTLLRVLAGADEPDEGTVSYNSTVRYEYLSQQPQFPQGITVLEAVMRSRPATHALLTRHAELCTLLDGGSSDGSSDDAVTNELHRIAEQLDHNSGWALEAEAKAMLQRLGVARFSEFVENLSGGLRKRVALANVLMSDADLLILDEPTNHLDADTVQWLQERLANSPRALLLITHDRYFLDAVVTRIVELDRRKLWSFAGNYEFYVEQKNFIIANEQATAEHLRNRLRDELDWLKAGARAQRKKQQSRVDWVHDLQSKQQSLRETIELKKIKIEVGGKVTGSQLVDAVGISKTIAGRELFSDFTYKAALGERIGIIGPNGSGKSTLLNIFAGEMPTDTGTLKRGASAKIGYFRQESSDIDPTQSVIGAVREIAEYVDTGVGRDRYLSAKDFLDRFNFHPRQHHSLVGNLSGGERRRLGLLRVLMGDPNVLLLDEPTNDFDIPTLNALEEYLEHFMGCLVIVSHDRAFLDKTVEFIYAFEERPDGITTRIKQYPGNYSAYLDRLAERTSAAQAERAAYEASAQHSSQSSSQNSSQASSGLASGNQANERSGEKSGEKSGERPKVNLYQLSREREHLERTLDKLEREKTGIEDFLNTSTDADYKVLTEKSNRLAALATEIDAATERWVELSEMMEKK
jgi:ABC transport system ATP-binding/permease protein